MIKNIVFIHGLFIRISSWDKEKLISSLNGMNCYFFEYNKWGYEKIEDLATEFNNFVKKIKEDFVLVGISQGGLIASYWLENFKTKKCKNCICLSVPFHGSFLAHLSRFPFSPFVGVKEMVPESSFLTNLLNEINTSKKNYYCIWDKHDKLIFPKISARLDFFKNKEVDYAVHLLFPKWVNPTIKLIKKLK